MFRADKKTIYINSSAEFVDAGGSNEDFTVTDTMETFKNTPKTVKLINACIPYTWYNVTVAIGNSIRFFDSVPDQYDVVISPGNYDGAALAAAIQTAMNAAGSGDTFTVEFSSEASMFTFTTTGVDMQLDFTIVGNMATILGFSEVLVGPGNPLVSTATAKLLIDLEFFICSDLVAGSDNGVIPWNTGTPDNTLNILARVPIRSCFGGIVDYTASAELPYYPITQSEFSKVKQPGDTTPRTVRFYLRWPSGEPFDLNGHYWTAEIVLDMNE
jgi:hypothetical protein